MDKKGRTRILIVIVAALWGYNIYRTIGNYQAENESEEILRNTPLSFQPMLFNKDTFALDLPLEDPFLRKNNTWRNRVSEPTVAAHTPDPVRQNRAGGQTSNVNLSQHVKWPGISYHGIVRNVDQEQGLCLLKIDNRLHKVRVGETRMEVKVITSWRDSVQVCFNNELKVIKKG